MNNKKIREIKVEAKNRDLKRSFSQESLSKTLGAEKKRTGFFSALFGGSVQRDRSSQAKKKYGTKTPVWLVSSLLGGAGIILLLGVTMVSSCGRDRMAAYMPGKEKARVILQTALDAWQSGQPYGSALGDKPKIEVFDASWREGKKLSSFEILEQVPERVPPQFNVRIQVSGGETASANYVIVGIDPMLVFSEAEYLRTTGQ